MNSGKPEQEFQRDCRNEEMVYSSFEIYRQIFVDLWSAAARRRFF